MYPTVGLTNYYNVSVVAWKSKTKTLKPPWLSIFQGPPAAAEKKIESAAAAAVAASHQGSKDSQKAREAEVASTTVAPTKKEVSEDDDDDDSGDDDEEEVVESSPCNRCNKHLSLCSQSRLVFGLIVPWATEFTRSKFFWNVALIFLSSFLSFVQHYYQNFLCEGLSE